MSGRVVAVHASPSHQLGKAWCPAIRLLAGLGVEGDAHCGVTVRHRSRVARDPTQPNLRQVHLVHHELLDDLAARGFAVAPGAMGENVTTQSLALLELPVGTHLHFEGGAVVELTGLRNPCGQLEGLATGLMAALRPVDAAGHVVRLAGVMGVVLTGGTITPGASIRVECPAGPPRPLEPV